MQEKNVGSDTPGYRVGVDIGGTFTDVVFLSERGGVHVKKLVSTPDDYSRAVLEALDAGLRELELTAGRLSEVSHAFTLATNAILEGRGVKTALITTEGFRDVLEISRLRMPRLYDLYYRKPPPLVERRLRLEVRERVDYRGEVLAPLVESDVEKAAEVLLDEGIRSVAVCLLHSYANPRHETRIGEILEEKIPGLSLSLSSRLLAETGEYERTSTTVINSYIRPIVARYLGRLDQGLRDLGVGVPLTVMQSNGGRASVRLAAEEPIHCVESGPAAGVVGAHHLAARLNLPNVLTLDMGGTTAKSSIIEEGELLLAREYEVGGGMSSGHRLMKGAGYILRVPSIDLAEVSAGGGSVARVDKGGSLACGPDSAGAVPGPACYGQGGDLPTVTDANLVLGFLNSRYLLGGDFPVFADQARAVIDRRLAGPLGVSAAEAAWGVHQLANSNMARAVAAVSSERGRDPRRFTLMAFGGGGPIHAAGLAQLLQVTRIIIPPSPGVFSCFGLLFSDVEHHLVQAQVKSLSQLGIASMNRTLDRLREQAHGLLEQEGFAAGRRQLVTEADLKYQGQTSHLRVRFEGPRLDRDGLEALEAAFHREHEANYGYRLDSELELVNLRVRARGLDQVARVPETLSLSSDGFRPQVRSRRIYQGPSQSEWIEAPVRGRLDLEGKALPGPALIEEYDSTTLVPNGWSACLDRRLNIILEREA
jgi:N-methylhydantoinase A